MKCKNCGGEFEPARRGQKYCSRKCRGNYWWHHRRKERKNPPPPSERICIVCGAKFYSKHNNKKCCSAACSAENNRLRNEKKYVKQQKAKWGEKPLALPKCKNCGQEFKPHDAAQKFCNVACYKEWRYKNSLKGIREARAMAKAAATKYGGKTLGEWIQEATDCNLDYGTYRGLIEQGKTYEELKAQAPRRQIRVHQHTPHRGE